MFRPASFGVPDMKVLIGLGELDVMSIGVENEVIGA
jgi:hypothetical protein